MSPTAFHFNDVLSEDDVLTASGGYEDVSFLAGLIHGGNLITCREAG